jgi:hypothetical protein
MILYCTTIWRATIRRTTNWRTVPASYPEFSIAEPDLAAASNSEAHLAKRCVKRHFDYCQLVLGNVSQLSERY